MALLQHTGTFLARPVSWAIKYEEGKCPRFAVVFNCLQSREGGEWQDIVGDQNITGFFTLINNDGGPNEINLRALKDSLGWDGASFASLEGGDWGDKEVQIVVDTHEYQGKTSLEVRYLNPKDYAGGRIQKADPQAVQSLDQKYGATLRALFKTAKPANGSASKPSPAAVAPPAGPDGAKQAAWETFIAKTPEYTPADRVQVFKQVVSETLAPGTDPKTCTVEQWQQIQKTIADDFDPVSKSLIPF